MRGISLHRGRSHSISAGTTILTVTCAKLGIIIIIKTLWHVLLCADKQQQPFAMKWSYYYSRPWLIIFLAQHITSHPDMAHSPSFWKTFPGVTNVKLYDDTGHYLHKRSTNIQVAVRAVTVEMIRSVLQKDECVKDEPVTGMTVRGFLFSFIFWPIGIENCGIERKYQKPLPRSLPACAIGKVRFKTFLRQENLTEVLKFLPNHLKLNKSKVLNLL